MKNRCLFLVCILPIVGAVRAGQAASTDVSGLVGGPFKEPAGTGDKSAYTLFNPVPDDQLRAFSTDRPGKTHSSTTVDAGHFQVESDILNYTYDRYSRQQQTTQSYSVGTPILKAGITDHIDLEAAFALFNRTRVTDRTTGTSATASGFGDISLGSKINLFGNEGARYSLALLPFVKLPTAGRPVGNGVTEVTLNVPYTVELDSLWSVTAEPALGLLKNAANNGLHGDYSFLVNVNRPVFTKALTAAVEVASEYASDRQIPPRYTLDPSLQWLVTKNLQFDIGVYLGLNKAAPDYNPYAGVSYRY